MKKRYAGYAVWLFLAGLLYFFENNAGTRIVLASSLLLPLIPAIRRSLFGEDETGARPRAFAQTVQAFAEREEDDGGDIRAYLPGDPVNRIHWKLTAKRDEIMVREQAKDQTSETADKEIVLNGEAPAARSRPRRVFTAGFSLIALALILLFALPGADQGMKALANRLFDLSEAVNAYAYDRFPVSPDQPSALAAALLAVMALSLLCMTLFSGSRLMALCIMAGCAVFQIYFGLAFPAWSNVPLTALFALWSMKRPPVREAAVRLLIGVAVISLIVFLAWPGVDTAVEAASEKVRDLLNRSALRLSGTARETPSGMTETRHMHTQSLTQGDGEARTDKEYRLVTVEEEQISMPHWVDYLRIILLTLLAAAVVILPFVPFALLNRRRKTALDARKAFESENVNEAVFAIFQCVISWLEATGNGEDNLPYAAWRADLSPEYAERFKRCEKLFEEAAYSTHQMREEQRRQALELLEETERTLLGKAGWKQRLRLRYREFLWI